MSPFADAAQVAFALGAAWLAPGAALVIALRLGRTALERWTLSLALGRLVLAFAGLVVPSTLGAGALRALGPLALIALFAAARRAQRRGEVGSWLPERDDWGPLAVAAGAGALLALAVIARGGADDGSGALVFYGRDSTHDPLVYASVARALVDRGLPLVNPFAGGVASTSSYLTYGLLAGLHAASGAPLLDLVFRAVPFAETIGAGVTAACLARALGGGRTAAALAAFLLPLGSEASFLVDGVGALLGRAVRPHDSWTLFGPYLLPINPIAPALQALFSALVLLAHAPAAGRRHAAVAGVLVASLFETKLFVWAPVVAALVAAALLRPPPAAAGAARLAAAVAVLASLPSLVEKAWWARTLQGSSDRGFTPCPGCLPRYLVNASLGDGELSFRLFREFRPGQLADASVLAAALAASLLLLAIVVGARVVALPVLWRMASASGDASATVAERAAGAGVAGRALAARVAGGAALVGAGLSLVVVVPPHYLNGAQFAWVLGFGLWPWCALAIERALARRRFALAVIVVVAALPGTSAVLGRLGFGARMSQRVSPAERDLLERLEAVSSPLDVVLEPSMLVDPDRPSAVPWLAGRPVHLSLLSVAQNLSQAEIDARFDRVVTVFAEGPRDEALAAVRDSGARFVLAPTGRPLPFDPGDAWEVVARTPAGVLYRVPEAGGAARGAGGAPGPL